MRGTLLEAFSPAPDLKPLGPEVEADYNPIVFNAPDLENAKEVILTGEKNGNVTSADRWRDETRWMENYLDQLNLSNSSVVLDYGCGVGRLSKLLIERYGCLVVGVDISLPMLTMAISYVGSDSFVPMTLSAAHRLEIEFDAAIAVWVLQHCQQPWEDVGFIKNSLKSDGSLMVLNELFRFVPIIRGRQARWLEDKVDVWGLLTSQLHCTHSEPFCGGHGKVGYFNKRSESYG